jgi:hypothetical protein
MKRTAIRNLILTNVLLFMFYGCSGDISVSENSLKPEKEEVILQDFDGDYYNGGVWAESGNEDQKSFKTELQSRIRVGDQGQAIALDYDFKAGAELLGGVWLDLSEYDFSSSDYIGFWIKGEETLGFSKIIGVTVEDSTGKSVTKMSSRVSAEWSKIEVSLSDFSEKERASIVEINIFIDKRYTGLELGRYYIDNLYLK